jgi:hypothetical protein
VIWKGQPGEPLQMHIVKVFLACFLVTCPCLAQSVPPTKATTLDGSAVAFPKPASQKPLLVIVGFSRKSSEDFKVWNQRALSPYLADARIDYYELADLQEVPSMVRSLIVHGMRRDVPKAQHSHFAPLTAGEDEWKKTVGYSASRDTYLILAEPSGHVVWQTSGVPDEQKVAALKQALAKLIPAAQP